ncbi:MAG: DUF3794 domain-containing protein [Peptostreptococcaceae bacterium]
MLRDTISYTGVSDYIPSELNAFTQMNINEILKLKRTLPSIDEILKVNVSHFITDKNVVKTATGKSLEGQILTGMKLISEGEFVVRIDYSSDEDFGGIHTFKEKIYFSNATSLPETSSTNSRVVENVYVEDIYANKLDQREIIVNISFIFAIENF